MRFFLSPRRSVVTLAALSLCAAASVSGISVAHAQTTLAENLVATDNGPDYDYYGQSLKTISGTAQYNNIKFNFYTLTGVNPALQALAQGTLYAYSQEYSGNPAGLGVPGSGYLGSSTGITNNQYVFAPGFTLSGGTTYYFYADQQFSVAGQYSNTYADGDVYYSNAGTPNFVPLNENAYVQADAAFHLEGTAVTPEASSVVNLFGALLAPGLAGMVAVRRRRKAVSAA